MTIAPPTAIAELRHWHRWVVWRTVERDGKTTKVPFQPNGRPASSTDPETWSNFDDCALIGHRFDGLGYVFAVDDEYAGIDLDKCVDYRGHVHPDALAIIDQLASYTELSPSGTGLHVLIRASINGGRNRTKKTPWGGDFESYDRARFFTVTAKHLAGTPETIEARQEELDAIRAELFPEPGIRAGSGWNGTPPSPTSLDDIALEEKIRASKQGPKFAELFDRGAGEGQESEADLGLCNILAFWLGPDPARIDQWFRRSALMREKWDDKRGETTYGGYTIDRALEDRTDFYGGNRPESVRGVFQGRIEAEEGAREHLAELLALGDLKVVGGTRSAKDTTARVVIEVSDGSTLDLNPISSYTTSAKLTAEIALQIGTTPDLKGKVPTVLQLVRTVCDLREETTADDRALDLMTSFMQEAGTRFVDFTDQGQRAEAFDAQVEMDPVGDARTEGVSIARKAVVLVDTNNGIRYVRRSWFNAYVKAHLGPGGVDKVANRLFHLGWSQPGKSGRIKASPPGGGKDIIMTFYTVPEGWENR